MYEIIIARVYKGCINMIKLVASDIDGTILLNGKREISVRLVEQIKQLKRMGILFVASSGRQIPNLKRLFAPVADDIAYIAENGALIEYNGDIIFKKSIDRKIGLDILEDIRVREGCEILLSGENTSYLEPKTASYEQHMINFVKNNVKVVDDITKVKEEFLKISVYEKDSIDNCSQYFKQKWSDKVTVVTSGYKWLDMVNKEVNKGVAMDILKKHCHLDKSECMAFGDNYNDYEMLASVKYSYAMESAMPGVADNCYGTTDTVENCLSKVFSI